ncbi:unnamed protein product [Prunus brigantina]
MAIPAGQSSRDKWWVASGSKQSRQMVGRQRVKAVEANDFSRDELELA